MTRHNDLGALVRETAPSISARRATEVSQRVMNNLGVQEAAFRFTLAWLFAPLRPVALGGAVSGSLVLGVLVGAAVDVSPDLASATVHALAGGGF